MTREPDQTDDERATPSPGDETAEPFAPAWAAGPASPGWATPGSSPAAPDDRGSDGDRGRLEPGRVLFEKYRVIRKLGGGAMGEVWLVRHLSLDRDHALKVIAPGLASDPGVRARFDRESKVMAAFHHRHAATVHDARLDEAGGYIDMEYIPGRTVHAALEAARAGRRPGQPLMPLSWQLRILDQLCDVLQVAHEKRIVHRDLKPSNLMLLDGLPAGREELKVLDFGIAKILDGQADHVRTVGFLGTPAYSSPEQVLEGAVDGRSDLYSVGVLLYEFLTGRVPFQGAGTVVMYHHAHRPPPPFAEFTPGLEVPPGVEPVVRRCLAKRPEDRPQSARELFEEFRRAVNGLDPAPPVRSDADGGLPEVPPTLVPATGAGLGETPPALERSGEVAGRSRHGRRRAWIAALLVAAVLGAIALGLRSRPGPATGRKGTGEPPPSAPANEATIVPASTKAQAATAARAGEVFRAHCLECHGGGKAKGGVKVLDRDLLIGKEQVVPGRPDDSTLYLVVTAEDDTAMPPPDRPRLDAGEIEAIRAWIADGAPPFPVVDPKTEPAPVRGGVEPVLASILADVRSLPPDDRPFARYFSLDHLRVGGIADDELGLHRDALAKAINHLSRERAIVRPSPVGTDGTVFRVDLRSLGWDRRPFERIVDGEPAGASPINLFDLALLEYPYASTYESSPTFDALAAEFLGPAAQARPVAFVRADWFVSVATRPPLYEDFLQLPAGLKELEEQLGVVAAADLESGRARRAGLAVSGVSRNNRVVQRHPSRDGAYWLSFDFRSGVAEENLFRDPIDLHPAGGEVIFSLPNGLQGYLLADARGDRLESAPTEIVTDRFAADQVVRNGLSCLRCHDAGMKGFVDEVRPALERLPDRPGFDKGRALRLYPPRAEMDRLLKEDADRFQSAMTRALGKAPAREPLTPVARRFLDGPLALPAVAAELGLATPDGLGPAFGSPALAGLGLAPLAAGGVVRRDAWEESIDRVSRHLGLGVPIVALDGLTRREVRPDPADFDVELATNHRNNLFAPGDDLVITVTNPSEKVLHVELIGTDARGRKVLLTPGPIALRAGGSYRIPERGAIKIQPRPGKERVTVFAAATPLPAGELLRGRDVTDRVVHPFYRGPGRNPGAAAPIDPARVLKKTIEIETR